MEVLTASTLRAWGRTSTRRIKQKTTSTAAIQQSSAPPQHYCCTSKHTLAAVPEGKFFVITPYRHRWFEVSAEWCNPRKYDISKQVSQTSATLFENMQERTYVADVFCIFSFFQITTAWCLSVDSSICKKTKNGGLRGRRDATVHTDVTYTTSLSQ